MDESERQQWGTILWEKWKFVWAILLFLILDLGLVALWAVVLVVFHKLIHLIDPTNSFILLVILKWFVEISTSCVVVYSTLEDVRKAAKRIRYGPKEISGAQLNLLSTQNIQNLSDAGIQQQTTDRVTTD